MEPFRKLRWIFLLSLFSSVVNNCLIFCLLSFSLYLLLVQPHPLPQMYTSPLNMLTEIRYVTYWVFSRKLFLEPSNLLQSGEAAFSACWHHILGFPLTFLLLWVSHILDFPFPIFWFTTPLAKIHPLGTSRRRLWGRNTGNIWRPSSMVVVEEEE